MFSKLVIILGVAARVLSAPNGETKLVRRYDQQYVQTRLANTNVTPVDIIPISQIPDGAAAALAALLEGLASYGSADSIYFNNAYINGTNPNLYGLISYNPMNGINTNATFEDFQEAVSADSTQAENVAGYMITQMQAGDNAVSCGDLYNPKGWMGEITLAIANNESTSFDLMGACS